MAIPLFLVISEATKPIRRTFRSLCSFEKPSSDDRFFRTISPSSNVTGLPPISINFVRTALAIVDLPEPDRPVKNKVKPCCALGGCDARSCVTTSSKENQLGISSPSLNLRLNSVPDNDKIVTSSLSEILFSSSYCARS